MLPLIGAYARERAAFGRVWGSVPPKAGVSYPFQGLPQKRPGPPPRRRRRGESGTVAETEAGVSGVAQRYASALFEIAREENALDEVATDLEGFSGLLTSSEDLMRLVKSPIFSSEEQTRAIAAVLEKAGTGVLTANFIKVVASNRRLFALPDIIRAFRQMLAKERGEVTANVTSAEPLSAAQVKALSDALKESLGKDVTINQKVDESLIGGLVVQVGSRMVDTSLKTKLNALKFAMKEAS